MSVQFPPSALPTFEQLKISIDGLIIVSEKLNSLSEHVNTCVIKIDARLENIKARLEINDPHLSLIEMPQQNW